MEILNSYIPKGFGVKPRNVRKEKSGYILQTERGERLVKRLPLEAEDILFVYRVKEELWRNGFTQIDRFYLTLDKQPYLYYDNDYYVMTDYFTGTEAEFSDGQEVMALTGMVASMHKCLEHSRIAEAPEHPVFANPLGLHKKSEAEMKLYKKRLPPRMSDFDVCFLKNYSYYMDLMSAWAEFVEETKCFSKVNLSAICHNALKEENILSAAGGRFLLNFQQCTKGAFVFDLADIIHRHLKATDNQPVLAATQITAAYNAVRPLSKDEQNALYATLKFPGRFLRLLSQYYDRKRSWVPASLISRMEDTVRSKRTTDAYIDKLLRIE